MGMGAFFGNGSCPAQIWIDLRIEFGKWLHDLLRVILIHDFDGLFFARCISITELRFWRRKYQCRSGTWAKCRKSNDGEHEGEKFSHKARVLSGKSAGLATVFFLRT